MQAVPQIEASELTVTQILKIVPSVKRGNKTAVQQSALDLGTIAHIKNLHKRLHLSDFDAKSHTVRKGDIRAARGLRESCGDAHISHVLYLHVPVD